MSPEMLLTHTVRVTCPPIASDDRRRRGAPTSGPSGASFTTCTPARTHNVTDRRRIYGDPPFGLEREQIQARIFADNFSIQPPPSRSNGETVPVILRSVITECLSFAPGDRPTAADLVDKLAREEPTGQDDGTSAICECVSLKLGADPA